MKSRILLIVPPFPERTYPGRSMGIEYINSYLRSHGFYSEVFDADVWGEDLLYEKIKIECPQIVGITNMSFQADVANDIAREIRKFLPKSLIIKGGSHEAGGGYLQSLSLHTDYVDLSVVGEGEETMLEIVKLFEGDNLWENLNAIDGIVYLKDSVIQRNKARNIYTNINNLIPTRNNHNDTHNFTDIFNTKKTAQVMTTRGCSAKCYYCYESTGPNKVRRRSEESLRQEFKQLKRDGYEAIYFDDPTFTENFEHVNLLCGLMREFKFSWGCNTRVDSLSREIVFDMANSGCCYIFCGVESVIPGVLLGLNKTREPIKYLESTKRAYQWFNEANIPKSVFLIFGGPKVIGENGSVKYGIESDEDIEITLRWVLNELAPDYLSLNILRLLPDLPLSYGKKFSFLRYNEDEIHAGFYDKYWLAKNNKTDHRSLHDIFSAFEGRYSVNSSHMTVEKCYNILHKALNYINDYKEKTGKQVKIVVGNEFENKYMLKKDYQYILADIKEMEEVGIEF